MRRFILFAFIVSLILIGCTTPPPATESSAVQNAEPAVENNEPQVGEKVDGPVATAVVVIGAESTNEEGYPPPAQTVAEGYPEPAPEQAQAAAGYPEPAQEAVPAADAAPQQVPDIAGDGDVQILFVSARSNVDDSWNFAVTLEHEDTGWEDYADGWDVVLPDGSVIKPNADSPFTRLLLHPHENEQPFTRSQSGIVIPADVTTVYVRAHELVEGYSSQVMAIDLTADGGEGFEVIR